MTDYTVCENCIYDRYEKDTNAGYCGKNKEPQNNECEFRKESGINPDDERDRFRDD